MNPDISTIYKENSLYDIQRPFAPDLKVRFSVPDSFSGVAILYEFISAAELPDDLEVFVSRVIEGGMKLEPDTVLKANLCHADISLQKLAEQAKAKIVVIFGHQWVDSLRNTQIHKNDIVKLYGMKVLVTDTLETIRTDDAAKKAFWLELKKLF